MGKLTYGAGGDEIEFDDRVLAHLQPVIYSKLRRNESFHLDWERGAENGSGRSSIWIHPTIALRFTYYGNRMPPLNRAWMEAMMEAANSAQGLRITREPPEA